MPSDFKKVTLIRCEDGWGEEDQKQGDWSGGHCGNPDAEAMGMGLRCWGSRITLRLSLSHTPTTSAKGVIEGD